MGDSSDPLISSENSFTMSEETTSTETQDHAHQALKYGHEPQGEKVKSDHLDPKILKELASKFSDLSVSPSQTEHKFWDTMPVPKLAGPTPDKEYHGPIAPKKEISEVRQTPYVLDSQFYWCECDLFDPTQASEVYQLLRENYVEDDGHMFRFKYSIEFIQWALTPPGYLKDWHIGVRVAKNDKLVAFIAGTPSTVKIHSTELKLTQIDFLCIHKKLRSKRLAPILIKEVTRRVNLKGIWQAVYTAGIFISKPVSTSRYYHRTINSYKLVKTGFTSLGNMRNIRQMNRFYRVDPAPKITGIRAMKEPDVDQVHTLTKNFYQKFNLSPIFSPQDIAHWFLPRDNIVYTYVVESPSGELTDLLSFYLIESDYIRDDQEETIRGAYSFVNIANTVSIQELVSDGLHFAKENNIDVFNALDLAQNSEFLKDLKFGKGDGKLQYYLFNWSCPLIQPQDVALVLM